MNIDFTHPNPEPSVSSSPTIRKEKKQRRFSFRKFFLIVFLAILGTGITFSTQTLLSVDKTLINNKEKTPLLTQLKYLVATKEKRLQGESKDEINILLLGMGGPGHSSGIYLTDTIMLIRLKPSTNQVGALSIPRDLVVEIPGTQEFRKINSLNALGREKKVRGGGEIFTLKAIESMLDLSIPYVVSVDFTGFRKIIDLAGGIDITVESSFTDYAFPDYQYGYAPVTFTAGSEHMNGERALQYSRSRHGSNGEGSDFARSRRQQQVLTSLKKKLLSASVFANPITLSKIIQNLGDHISTNIEMWEMARFAQLAGEFSEPQIKNIVLDSGSDSPLHAEISDQTGAYVLVPDAGLGNYKDLQNIVDSMFQFNELIDEGARVEIQNGTKHAQFASQIAKELRLENLNIVRFGNADRKDVKKTVVIDLSYGTKPKTVRALQDRFHANVSTIIPSFVEFPNDSDLSMEDLKEDEKKRDQKPFTKANPAPDIIVILGEETWKIRSTTLSQNSK